MERYEKYKDGGIEWIGEFRRGGRLSVLSICLI